MLAISRELLKNSDVFKFEFQLFQAKLELKIKIFLIEHFGAWKAF